MYRTEPVERMRHLNEASKVEKQVKRIVASPLDVLVDAEALDFDQCRPKPMVGSPKLNDRVVGILPAAGGFGRHHDLVAPIIPGSVFRYRVRPDNRAEEDHSLDKPCSVENSGARSDEPGEQQNTLEHGVREGWA